MPVGGYGAQHRRAADIDRMKENAVEIVPRLLRGNRELRVVDQALEFDGGQQESMREFARGQVGKIRGRQALQEKPRTTRPQKQLPALARDFQAELRALGQFAYDVVDYV